MLPRRGLLPPLIALPFNRRAAAGSRTRVRPGDPGWPTGSDWQALNTATNRGLSAVTAPLNICRADPGGDACGGVFRSLKNPYAIGDDPALTQTCGWLDAWTTQPSAYVVAAETAADVAASVNFARNHNLRLVIRGGGHSYLGTSTAPDSLMIWTRRMNAVVTHDAFVPAGCDQPPQPAVSVGAGAIWMHVYNAVTTRTGRYVQGGGCGTVGVAGLVQGGGFGSYSKNFGTAGAGLLEAEVVTADGTIRIANACTNPDLFWALKGGGGGTLGAVTRLTLRTYALPDMIGVVSATIQANSDEAYRSLIFRFMTLYADQLLNPTWGESATLRPRNRLRIALEFQGIDRQAATSVWQRFFQWIAERPADFAVSDGPTIVAAAARQRWDPEFFRAHFPQAMLFDDRPGASPDNMYWSGNLSEAGHFIQAYESTWLPAALLNPDQLDRLVDALCAAARHAAVELHFQKGLAGAAADTLAATAATPMNPAVLRSFALAITGSEGPPAFPGLLGHEPDLQSARRNAARVMAAFAELTKIAADAGTYLAESSYFQPDWQHAYWGANYPRLQAVKQKYDPDGLFFARHGVGSEAWTQDGFTIL
jgi:FAD/FMN-containing dehydrogenase